MPARALIFDFNGTLSDDEDVMEAVTQDVLGRYGPVPTHDDYIDRLAGFSDDAIVRIWLGERPDLDRIVEERVQGYRERVADGRTVTTEMRELVRRAAERVPVAIVSGAALSEIAPVLDAAGIAELFRFVVSSDDVREGKPHPEGYLIGLERLGELRPGLRPDQVAVIEDTEAGVTAAKAAGLHTVALVRTMPAARLAAADELVDVVDWALIERLLGRSAPARSDPGPAAI